MMATCERCGIDPGGCYEVCPECQNIELADELTRLRARETVLHGLLWEALECMPESSLSERIEQALATKSED